MSDVRATAICQQDVHPAFMFVQSGVHEPCLASPPTSTLPKEGSMRKFRKHASLLAGLLALSLVSAACGSDDPAGNGATDGGTTEPELEGSITISGSSTVEPISSIVAEIFN
jgi:hypothetical protein